MTNEYIVTGKTVEEAMAAAHAQYGSEGEVSYEILEMPKKGFLGIGAAPARIRVTVSEEDKLSLDSLLSEVKSMKNVTDKGSDGTPARGQTQNERPQAEARPVQNQNPPRPQTQNPAPRPAQGKPQQNPRPAVPAKPQTDTRPAQNPPRQSPKPVAPPRPPRTEEPVMITEEEMACAVSFAENLLRSMELDARVVRQTGEDGKPAPRLNIEGEDTGILIGHHGETLDAIQYLVNLSANRRAGSETREFVKISVDVENYRAKREEALRALARRMAEKCRKYKKNIVLEPMNPYERRIIHSEIQDIPDVSTHSVGYDENRKIVVTYEGADKPAEPVRTGNQGQGGNGSGSGSGRRRHHRGSGSQGGSQGGAPAGDGIRTLPQRDAFRPKPAPVPAAPKAPEYPDDLDTDDVAAADYTYEKKPTPKPEKMSFEAFAAVAAEDIPMGILSKKPSAPADGGNADAENADAGNAPAPDAGEDA